MPIRTPDTVAVRAMRSLWRSSADPAPAIRTNLVDISVTGRYRPRSGRAFLLRQLADDHLVGLVDRLVDLVVRDSTTDGERVPARPSNVGHHAGVVGVAVQPLVGDLAGGTALEADGAGTEEGEDLR